jgi:hypothetical protein
MIRFKNIEYSDGKFSFNVNNEIVIGNEDLTKNTKYIYTKLSKYYNIKGLSRYNKDDLIQNLVDNFGYEYKPEQHLIDKMDNCTLLSEASHNLISTTTLETKMAGLNIRINPIDEMNHKLTELQNDPNFSKYKEDSLRCSYTYRIWLWNNHNTTYEDEISRIVNIT